MVQALRSFKLWNQARRVMTNPRDESNLLGDSDAMESSSKLSAVKRKKVGAPLWAQLIGYTCTIIIFCFLVCKLYGVMVGTESDEWLTSRRLRNDLCSAADDDEEDCPSGASHPALVIPYFIGVFYIFIGIAIVCDEFFVPALEQIGIFLDLSDDVCGATLMAAGGSAPELATSLIGTFQGSSVGFGTIVGSAIFNVLFVISCCVLSTPKELAPLELTGWPLARDCLYYSFTLVGIAVFFGAITPGVIEGWEAAILFAMYLVYVILMRYNDVLYEYFNPPAPVDSFVGELPTMKNTADHLSSVREDASNNDCKEDSGVQENKADVSSFRLLELSGNTHTPDLSTSNESQIPPPVKHHQPAQKKRRRSSVNGIGSGPHKVQSVNICPSNARAGFFHLICQQSVTDTAGVAIVNKIKGDVRESFDALDKDKSGTIDMQELKGLLRMLAHDENAEISDEEVRPVMEKLDLDGSGELDFSEFTIWYVSSKERLHNEVKISWAKFDKDHMGMPLSRIEDFLSDMNLVFTEERYDDIINELMVCNIAFFI